MVSGSFHKRFRGKVAAVTGVAGSIGKALAHRLAWEGAHLVISDPRPDLALKVKEEMEEKGLSAVAVSADVSDAESARYLFGIIEKRWGAIDVLINDSSAMNKEKTMLDDDGRTEAIRVSLYGCYHSCREAACLMRENNGGKIVNIAPCLSFPTYEGGFLSAAGIAGLTRALAKELGPNGINVNAVVPGTSLQTLPVSCCQHDKTAKHLALRQESAKQIAGVCLFLASDEAACLTGQVIYLGRNFMASQLDRYSGSKVSDNIRHN